MPESLEIESSNNKQQVETDNEIVLYRPPLWRRRSVWVGLVLLLVVLLSVILGVTVGLQPSNNNNNDPSTTQWRQLGTSLSDDSWFDVTLALSNTGNLVVVGNRNLESVSIYEYKVESDNWILLDTIVGDDNSFGISIALSRDGSTIAIGGHLFDDTVLNPNAGHVVVYRRTYTTDTTKYEPLGQSIVGEGGGDQAGFAVSLSGDGTVLSVGAHLNSQNYQRAGHVRVYELNSSSDHWVQRGNDLDGLELGDQFGGSLDLSDDGSIIGIGGRFHDKGMVQVHQFQNSGWVQVGADLVGEFEDEEFGYSVSLSGDGRTIAVGNAMNQVKVFEYNSGSWTIATAVDIGSPVFLYVSLSFDGATLAVLGKPRDQQASSVTVLQKSNGSWKTIPTSFMGMALALSGDGRVLAVGSNDSNEAFETVRVLQEATM